MNERIRELVRQAGLDDADFPIEDWDNVPLAKYAELIVQECIGAISEVKEVFFKFRLETDDFTEKNKFWAGEDACNQSVRKIETLFGVK